MVNKDFSVKQLTVDHTPDTPSEKQRIVSKGGKVKKGRINGMYGKVVVHPSLKCQGRLGVSRGFGAFPYKNTETFTERLVCLLKAVVTSE